MSAPLLLTGALIIALALVAVLSAVQTKLLRDLYEMYRCDRDTLTIQLRDAFEKGWRNGSLTERAMRDRMQNLYQWAATNPVRRPCRGAGE